jgi:Transposase DDE domain
MRPIEILQNQLDRSLGDVHLRRRDAVWRGVAGVLAGGKLWLTALGRSLPGRASDKHRIKAADRLLGNKAIHGQLALFYRALARLLVNRIKHPLVVIDWTQLDSKHYILSAQLCCEGRTLPLYSRVYPRSKLGNPRVQQQFLHELALIVPGHCKPILITDAGFRTPWFDAVTAIGWDFIGRIRNRTKVHFEQRWVPVKRLHQLANPSHARDLGWLQMRRQKSREYRLVLSKRPKLKGRTRLTFKGRRARNTIAIQCSSGAREPWLLATSLTSNCTSVVRTYGLRMQIEQSFRDAKSHRHGWSLRHARSRSSERLEVMLLIGALASVVVQMVGRAAASLGLQRHFQANTVVRRRVLSAFVLGRHILRTKTLLPPRSMLTAMTQLVSIVALNSAPFEQL